MSSIEETLRNTLASIADKTNQANGDLHEAVVELTKAIESISSGLISVALQKIMENERMTTFSLQMISVFDGEKRELGKFGIPLTGYPISASEVHGSGSLIHNKDKLMAVFNGLVRDTSSPLVVYLAYALRRQKGS